MFFIINIQIRSENIHFNTSHLNSTFRLINQSEFSLRYQNRTEYIPYDFDPTGVDPLNFKGEKTIIGIFEAQYSSNPSKDFIYELSCETGKFYGGRILFKKNSILQNPTKISIMHFSYDKIKLGSNYPTTNIFLARSKFDFTFSIFWLQFFNMAHNLIILENQATVEV